MHEATSSPGEPHLVVSYDRGVLGQTGAGHFSPVGGYHAGRDLVLILDVARFKYPPHWVPLETLFQAMLSRDPVTGRSRGFAQLWRDPIAPREPSAGPVVHAAGCTSAGAPCGQTSVAGNCQPAQSKREAD